MGVKRYDDGDLQRLGWVIGEHIVDRFKLGFEAIDQIKLQVNKIPGMEADLAELKSDMKVVKHVLKATDKDLQSHNKRITKLEKAVFHA